MDSSLPEARRQAALLAPLQGLSLSDVDLAALLARAGVHVSRDEVGRYRRGERSASAGFVSALLRVLPDGDLQHLVGAWLADRPALRVTVSTAQDLPDVSPAAAMLDLAVQAGRTVSGVADGLADGHLTTAERWALEESLQELTASVDRLRGALDLAHTVELRRAKGVR